VPLPNTTTTTTTANSSNDSFAVQVNLWGSLWGTMQVHRILKALDNNWPYIIEVEGSKNELKVYLQPAYKMEIADNITSTGPTTALTDDVWLHYVPSNYRNPAIDAGRVKKIIDWVSKLLPDQDAFLIGQCSFVQVNDSNKDEWFLGFKELKFTVDPSNTTDDDINIGWAHWCMPASLGIKKLDELEGDLIEVMTSSTTTEEAQA
jgi:hypothetical protein